MLQNSGMVNELSRATGLNQASAAKSLNAAFTLIGQRALGSASPSPSASGRHAAGSGTKNTR